MCWSFFRSRKPSAPPPVAVEPVPEPVVVAPIVVALGLGGADAVQTGGGGDDALLGILTVTEASGASKTNEPFSIAWPMGPDDAFTSSHNIKIYDDDGSGNQGSLLTNYQQDNLSTDANTWGRQIRIAGIIPSITANQTRKLRVYRSADAPPSGTAITESDLFATSWRVVVTFDIGGTSYVADSNDCEGASGTFSKTAACFHGTYVTGPAETCRVYSLPPSNGGTAHASGDGLRVGLHVYMRKAGTAAVSGGNPITHVKTRVILRNMDAARVSPANYWYGLTIERATSLSDGTLISTDYTDVDSNVVRYSFPRSSPAVTLTATGATSTGAKTWTIPSGSWATDILGAHIKPSSGSGGAYVTARNSATSISVYVYEAFAATSFTSGNWVIEGCGHEYGRKWDCEVNVGTQPTSIAIWGDHNSAVTTNSIAAITFLSSKKWLLNYSFVYSDVTLDMTNLNLMRSGSQVRPFTQLGPEGTLSGDVYTDVGATGERQDLGPQAGWNLEGLTKWSASGRRKIFENNRYWTGAFYNDIRRLSGSPSAGSVGVSPRADGGTEYRTNTAYSGTTINYPTLQWNAYDGDSAHHPTTAAIPFLLTGELMHIEELQGCEYYSMHITADAAYQGSGIAKTCFGDSTGTLRGNAPWGGSLQQRAEGWLLRDLALAYICTPDTANDKLYNAKTYYTTKVQNTWTRAAFVQTNYTNGSAGALEDYYDTDGPRYVGYRFNGNIDFGVWQANYVNLCMALADELGAVSTDTTSFLSWYSVGITNQVGNSDVPADWYVPGYMFARTTPDGTAVQSWADTWRAVCCSPLGQERTPFHRTPATITLSATSGASVTVTLTGSPLGQTSWYAPSGNFLGMWLYEASGGSGAGRIVSVSNANTCVIDTTVTGGAAFSSTTPTASNCRIPPPHPSDAAVAGSVKTFGSIPDYPWIFRASCAVTANRSGYAVSAQAGIDYVDDHDFYADIAKSIRYNIEPRA